MFEAGNTYRYLEDSKSPDMFVFGINSQSTHVIYLAVAYLDRKTKDTLEIKSIALMKKDFPKWKLLED